jgi:hypothetical protein
VIFLISTFSLPFVWPVLSLQPLDSWSPDKQFRNFIQLVATRKQHRVIPMRPSHNRQLFPPPVQHDVNESSGLSLFSYSIRKCYYNIRRNNLGGFIWEGVYLVSIWNRFCWSGCHPKTNKIIRDFRGFLSNKVFPCWCFNFFILWLFVLGFLLWSI